MEIPNLILRLPCWNDFPWHIACLSSLPTAADQLMALTCGLFYHLRCRHFPGYTPTRVLVMLAQPWPDSGRGWSDSIRFSVFVPCGTRRRDTSCNTSDCFYYITVNLLLYFTILCICMKMKLLYCSVGEYAKDLSA